MIDPAVLASQRYRRAQRVYNLHRKAKDDERASLAYEDIRLNVFVRCQSSIHNVNLSQPGHLTNSYGIVVRRPCQILARGLARNPTLSGGETSWRHRLPDLAA